MAARGAQEIRPGLWRLYESMGARFLAFYALRHDDGWCLFDGGLPDSVTGRLDEGSWQGPIRQVVVSHADADHLGDVARLKQHFPDLEVCCHPEDRPWVEDHDRLTQERYDHARQRFGYGYSSELLDALRQACGDDFQVDRTLQEGDTIGGADQQWQVLHMPGHSPGHVCLWCEKTGELLLGDAVLGRGPAGETGEPSMPPTHQFIGPYLNTLDRLAKLPVEVALPCHWTPMSGSAFKRFLQESREVVCRDLAFVEHYVRQVGEVSFEDVLGALNREWSTWPASEDAHYSYALAGTLEHLEAAGCLHIQDGRVRLA